MIDPIVRTYDFKNYVHVLGGFTLSGFDEEGITIARIGDMFTSKRGADGTKERSNNSAFDLELTLNVLKTNPINDVLSGIHNVDSLTNQSALPWLTKDLKGLSLVSCLHCWVRKAPDMNNKTESEAKVWVLETGPAAVFTGGTISGSGPVG